MSLAKMIHASRINSEEAVVEVVVMGVGAEP
jgi:hypothetical protein